jgi:hypothetical protein
VDAYTVIKPQDKHDAKETHHLIVPPSKQIYMLIGLKALDDRTYTEPVVWIYFPEDFTINYDIPYERMFFGKKFIAQTSHEARVTIDSPLREKAMGGIALPIVVKTPTKIGEYDVKVEFVSRGLDAPSSMNGFTVEVAEKDFSHPVEYFDWNKFMITTPS